MNTSRSPAWRSAEVLKLVGESQSYREISHRLGLSKNKVLGIVKRRIASTGKRQMRGAPVIRSSMSSSPSVIRALPKGIWRS
jgi:hypothetical protein